MSVLKCKHVIYKVVTIFVVSVFIYGELLAQTDNLDRLNKLLKSNPVDCVYEGEKIINSKDFGDFWEHAAVLGIIARAYEKQKMLDDAIYYYEEEAGVYQDNGRYLELSRKLIEIGLLCEDKLKSKERAKEYYYSPVVKYAFKITPESERKSFIEDLYELYVRVELYREAAVVSDALLKLEKKLHSRVLSAKQKQLNAIKVKNARKENDYIDRIERLQSDNAILLRQTRGQLDQTQQELSSKEQDILKQKDILKGYEHEKDLLLKERYKNQGIIEQLGLETVEKDKLLQSSREVIRQREEDIRKQKELLRLQEQATLMFGVIATLFAGIIVLVFFMYRTKRRVNRRLRQKNNEILEQKNEIERQAIEILKQRDHILTQNKEITDSIYYAEKIQKASLPDKSLFDKNLSDNFIFYQPKDILSGNFYWTSIEEDNMVIAVADCTGHGVPGAFMSMIGVTALNEIVGEIGCGQPNEILNRLRSEVIKVLQQDGSIDEPQDGMDIALCVVDKKRKVLRFASAYIYLIHISDGVLVEHKGDHIPIGMHVLTDRRYKVKEIPYKDGDIFYMFSDGIIDQFGGPNGKKFKKGQLYNLIEFINGESCADQGEIIKREFEDWRGEQENQTDDVMVFGFRP